MFKHNEQLKITTPEGAVDENNQQINSKIRNINIPPPPPPLHRAMPRAFELLKIATSGKNCIQILHPSTGFDGQIPLLKIKCFQ